MRRFLGLVLAIVGAGVCLWAAAYLLVPSTPTMIFGYHAMYPGLAGAVVLTIGLILRQD